MSENYFTRFYNYFFPLNPIYEKRKSNKHKSETYVLTIQILFSVIIGISFIDYHKELVPFNWNFETVMIFVAYATVLLSLIGYSIAIKSRYHRNFFRFGLDLFLLYLYYQLVYGLQTSFDYFLSIFPMIFGVYLIWQLLEFIEWRRDEKDKYHIHEFKRIFFGTIIFFVIFLVISLLYDDSSINMNNETDQILNYWPVTDTEIIILACLIVLLFFFRVFIAILVWKSN